jgi:spermidine/putrescine transport system ATP-binding protein
VGEDQELVSHEGSGVVVSARRVFRRFGDVAALDGVSLDVVRGEFISLLGPSGCGKTTLLRIIAGFERADSGDVLIGGKSVLRLPPEKRPVNMVFQRYALFPHKTVGENIAFGPSLRKAPKRELAQKVESLLRLVHLEGYADRQTTQLSGGQAQRVALARALANDPTVLLLDEPLSGLDLKLRQAMQVELREIQRAVQATFIFVTHDQEEALTMSDRIVLMNRGSIEQIGTPLQVYRHPETRFVSAFIGETNLFQGEVIACEANGGSRHRVAIRAAEGTFVARHDVPLEKGASVWLSVRPERMTLRGEDGLSADNVNLIAGRVEASVYLGSALRYLIRCGDGPLVTVQTDPERSESLFQRDESVVVEWPKDMGTLLCQ